MSTHIPDEFALFLARLMCQFSQKTVLQLVMGQCSASAVEKPFSVHQDPLLIFSLSNEGGPIGDAWSEENSLAEHSTTTNGKNAGRNTR